MKISIARGRKRPQNQLLSAGGLKEMRIVRYDKNRDHGVIATKRVCLLKNENSVSRLC